MDNKETLLDLKRRKQESKRKYKKKVGIEVILCGIVSLISMVYISHAGSDLFSVLSGSFLSFIVSGVFPFKTSLEWLLEDSNYDIAIKKLEKEIDSLSNEISKETEKTMKSEDFMQECEILKTYKDEEDIKEHFYEDNDNVKKDDNKFIKKRK